MTEKGLAEQTLGTESVAGGAPPVVPTVVLDGPLSTVSTLDWQADWTSTGQAAYRVAITSVIHENFDTGWVTSVAQLHEFIEGQPATQGTYRLEVFVRSSTGHIVSAARPVTFELPDVAVFVDSPDVGVRYEVGINGEGYMLADDPNGNLRYQRSRTTVDPERFQVGSDNYASGVGRHQFATFDDFSGGSGQHLFDRENANTRRYWKGEGVDPFGETLCLLPEEVTVVDPNFPAGNSTNMKWAALVNGDTWVLRDLDTVSRFDGTSFATDHDVDGGAGWEALDLVGGDQLYVVLDNNEIRVVDATTGLAGTSFVDFEETHRASWLGDRLSVWYTQASLLRWTTLTPVGAEEVAGGRISLPATWVPGPTTAGTGFAWFAASQEDTSAVWGWQVGAVTAPSVKLTLPRGDLVDDMYWYQGNVFILASRAADNRQLLYRCVPAANGTLTPFLVFDEDGTVGDVRNSMIGIGALMYFPFNGGLMAFDLATSGVSAISEDATRTVTGASVLNGQPIWVNGQLGYLDSGTVRSSGYLETSLTDAGATQDKLWTEAAIVLDPLPSGATVALAHTDDGRQSYVDAALLDTAGIQRTAVPIDVRAASVGLKISLTSDGTASPCVRLAQLTYHVLGPKDVTCVIPIDCADNRNDLRGSRLAQTHDYGVKAARRLEALVGSNVTFQDIDWPVTQESTVWEVFSVEVIEVVGTFNQNLGHRESRQIAVVTLRKSL